jgi:hypothetical protein
MPMLDEEEFAVAMGIFRKCVEAMQQLRRESGLPLQGASVKERFRPLLEHYEQVTGYKETNPNAVWHHRISKYGLPCKRCGKPLRSLKAKLCGACMWPVAAESI